MSPIVDALTAYAVLLGVSLVEFAAVKRWSMPQSSQNPFELFHAVDSTGTEVPLLSGIYSGLAAAAALIGGFFLIWFASQIVGSWVALLYVAILAGFMYQFVLFWRPLNRVRWLAARPRMLFLANWLLIGLVSTAWYQWPTWPVYNLTFLLLCYMFLATVGALRLSTVFIVFLILAGADVLAVFKLEIMQRVALGLPFKPPAILVIPRNPLALGLLPARFLGLGDILIGGILVMTAAKYKLDKFVTVGYAVGLFIVLVAAIVFNRAMPALLTIVPCSLAAFCIGYFTKRRELGLPSIREIIDSERRRTNIRSIKRPVYRWRDVVFESFAWLVFLGMIPYGWLSGDWTAWVVAFLIAAVFIRRSIIVVVDLEGTPRRYFHPYFHPVTRWVAGISTAVAVVAYLIIT